MRLALRLALTFGLLAAASSALVGIAVRYTLVATETDRFRDEVRGTCERIKDEVKRQADADRTLITGFCKGNELVEDVGVKVDTGELEGRRLSFSSRVATEREAFGMDELLVAIERGDLVGASPTRLIGMPQAEVDALIRGDASTPALRTRGIPAIVTRCTKASPNGRIVGMVAARHVDPTLDRIARTLGVAWIPSWSKAKVAPPAITGDAERVSCSIQDNHGASLPFDIVKSKRELQANVAQVDRSIGVFAILAAVVAFLVAVVLARNIGRPLAVLAKEAGKVAAGEAQPLHVHGSGEVRELGAAFDRMIKDLAVTRGRLAAASRVAAWREVARRVAHEVKNPLAPIRAAVETLRRLRARDDPRFDEYFDEATRTVLDEVLRISNIVTEFTRFARLPAPKPQAIDVEELARHVIQVHKATAGDAMLSHVSQRRAATLNADRDQIIQVLTNLVQNSLYSVKGRGSSGAVTLTTDTDGTYVTFSVADNGEGIAPEFAERLFEPYATTKSSGTGLGLAIAQRIAYEHDGELSYVGPSANGRGAVFRLVIPIAGPRATAEDAPASSDD